MLSTTTFDPVPLRKGRPARAARPERDEDKRIAGYFAGLEQAGGLLLAVSGGPDSIALLLMASRWARGLGAAAPRLYVASVDHGLRPDGRREAEMVAMLSAERGLPHAILTWTGPKPISRVQERARAARYALLADHARDIGATHILTAHHADDQAETVLLRLGRGSGLAGLAGMRRLSLLSPGLWLVRPLLDLTKADLVAACRAAGCMFVDDPSNHDSVYARVRLRAQAPTLAAMGLDTPSLSRFARRMARADAALEAEVDRVEAILGPERSEQSYRVALTPVKDMAPEIRIRLLRRTVVHVARGAPVRLDRLESLTEGLWAALQGGAAYHATLAGARVTLGPDTVLKVWAEGPRRRGVAQVLRRLDQAESSR